MQIYYRNQSENGGVYKITNIQNGRVYIGSTSCFRKRARSHMCDLEANRHLNRFMQNDFNKCKTESFLFEVLETVVGDKQERLLREQFYINQFYDDQHNCYNLVKEARDTRSGTRNKKQADPLTDKRFQPHTEEHKQKQAEGLKKTWSQEEYREMSRKRAYEKRWKDHSANILVTNKETGEKVVISGSVRQFCLDRGLSYKAFHQLVKGIIKSSGGWFIGEEEPTYIDQKGQKRGPISIEHRAKLGSGKFIGKRLIRDNGEEIIIDKNVKAQCRELDIPYTTLLKVLNGECKSVCGYKLSS